MKKESTTLDPFYRQVNNVRFIIVSILLLTLLLGCNIKNAPFFGPDFSEQDEDDMIPSTEMIVGDWDFTYTRQAFTCSGTQPEFTVGASIISSSPTSFIVQFPDAPAGISVNYDLSTGEFNGTTGEVDRGDGTTISESWDATLNYTDDPFSVFLEGESEVLLKDESGNTLCFVDYLIDGMRL